MGSVDLLQSPLNQPERNKTPTSEYLETTMPQEQKDAAIVTGALSKSFKEKNAI